MTFTAFSSIWRSCSSCARLPRDMPVWHTAMVNVSATQVENLTDPLFLIRLGILSGVPFLLLLNSITEDAPNANPHGSQNNTGCEHSRVIAATGTTQINNPQ